MMKKGEFLIPKLLKFPQKRNPKSRSQPKITSTQIWNNTFLSI